MQHNDSLTNVVHLPEKDTKHKLFTHGNFCYQKCDIWTKKWHFSLLSRISPLSACSIASIKISDMHLLFSRIIFITVNRKFIVRNMKNRRMQSGFTLIELVVVIAILGILAAVALPRFAALQTEARIAKMNGALGAIRAAAVLAHSVQLTQQLAPGATIVMEGSNIAMANGYPTGASIGIAAGLADGFVLTRAGVGTVFTVTPDAEHKDCAVTYTVPAAGFPPSYSNTGLTAANCQ